MTLTLAKTIKLGLIGDNITRSKSPKLHRTAGQLAGLEVTYDRLIPKDLNLTFDQTFEQARNAGFRGINVTYPYKEQFTAKVTVSNPLVRAIGAVNTVVFDPEGPQGYNTDYSGFMSAYRLILGDTEPGVACLIGTGGVGKAVAFGLLGLKATTIRCVDLDPVKAEALATALRDVGSDTKIEIATDPVEAAKTADGIINCTPLGMVGIIEASQTRKPSIPRTLRSGMTTARGTISAPDGSSGSSPPAIPQETSTSAPEAIIDSARWEALSGLAPEAPTIRSA